MKSNRGIGSLLQIALGMLAVVALFFGIGRLTSTGLPAVSGLSGSKAVPPGDPTLNQATPDVDPPPPVSTFDLTWTPGTFPWPTITVSASDIEDDRLDLLYSRGGTAPIYTAEQAISKSLSVFPESLEPTDEVARLLTHCSLDSAWYGDAPEPGSRGADCENGWSPDAPVWLVGFRAIGLTDHAYMAGLGEPSFDVEGLPSPTPAPVDGVYYAWDANSGDLRSVGALMEPPAVFNFARMRAIPNQVGPISAATPPSLP